MFAAIGAGTSRLRNYSSARDCQSTLDCLEALGVVVRREPGLITVEGTGIDGLRAPTQMLDAGNSGTTIRLLSGILAGQNFTSEITGDESKVEKFIDLMKTFGVIELTRTGKAAMPRR